MTAGALDGLRVLECGEGVSAAYAGKLFCELGAGVVKVEPPQGDYTRLRGPFPGHIHDREASGLFLYLNAGKRSLRLDLTTEDGAAALKDLASGADVLVHNLGPHSRARAAVAPERLLARNPALVLVDITSFGHGGPLSGYEGCDLINLCAGGLTHVCGAEPGRPDAPPVKPFGEQSEFQAACNAAVAAMGALFMRRSTGRGQWIDVSAREVMTSILGVAVAAYTYGGNVPTRLGVRGIHPWAFMDCQDGPILIFCVENEEWQRLVDVLGNPEWASWEIFADRFSRSEHWDVLRPLLAEEVAKWRVRDLYETAQRRRIPLAPVSSMADLFASPQLQHRKYFVDYPEEVAGRAFQMPGPPYQLSGTPWRLRGRAPHLGEHDASDRIWDQRPAPAPSADGRRLPLEGVRVLDFTWVWAGPYCTMQLAHLGAEVIKVESNKRLDTTRRFNPFADGEPGVNRSGYFNQYSQGKRSVTINLATPEGRALARRLADRCDVVVDNYAPGTMDKMGLGYEEIRRTNPGVICASLSGYGGDGPESRFISYGPSQEPLSGLSSLSGYRGGPPGDLGLSYGDPNAGIHGAFAILAALWHRERTGEGQRLELSLFETSINVIPEGVMAYSMNGQQPARMGSRDEWMSPHEIFRCRGEDRWVGIAARNEEEFRALCAVMGRPALASDRRFSTLHARKANEDDLEAIVGEWTATRDAFEVAEALQAAGVPAFPSLTVEDLLADPQLEASGFFTRLEHPEVGTRPLAGIPWRLSETDVRVHQPAPLLGEANAYVFGEILGLGEGEVAALVERGVIY